MPLNSTPWAAHTPWNRVRWPCPPMEARLIRARCTRTVINIRVTAHVASFTPWAETAAYSLLKAARDSTRDSIRTVCQTFVTQFTFCSRCVSAYTSWMRFYSSYPRDMREIFNRRTAHLGHYAKSFALRETPQRIGGIGKKLHEKDNSKQRHNNRLTNER